MIIAGDFNIHVDNLQDRETKELYCLFENYGLTQYVAEPTHIKGHTLDLIISKGLNTFNVVVTDVALSDHFCVFFKVGISVCNRVQTKIVRKRYITESTSESFTHLFSSTPAVFGSSITELVNNFNCKVTSVIDAIAPIRVKVVSSKKRSPWRNDPLVRSGKRECRIVERKWRKTNLQVHFAAYKEILRIYNLELRNARRSFFSNIIDKNNNNAHALFATVNRLTNPPIAVASELLSTKACNDFATFFSEKNQKIS